MTPYTGNPAATQAPSPPPTPGAVVVVNLPQDADPPNGSTWEQAYKVLADFVAWLFAPFAKLGSWAQPIFWWRNAVLQKRFAVCHLGYPAGKFLNWQEDWCDVGYVTKNAIGNGGWNRRWNFSIAGAAANSITVVSNGPNTPAFPRVPCALLSAASSGVTPNSHAVEHIQPILFTADTDMSIQWDMEVVNGNAAITEFAMGVALSSQLGVAGTFISQALDGAALVKRPSVANWDLYTKAPAVASTLTTTGVTSMGRVRMEIRGANVSDDGVARVLLHLDGAAPINVGVDLSGAAAAGVLLYPFFRLTTTGVLSRLYVGPVDFRDNTAIGSVVI